MPHCKILIIDDDPAWLAMAVNAFFASKYKVYSAATCADGLKLLDSYKPDCILLDYGLPDVNADVFCRKVRSVEKLVRIPIIVVSGSNTREMEAITECQADAFVLKVTHGCKQNIFCKNKSEFDWNRSAGLLEQHLKYNHYRLHREWAYKNIIPRIICEEYLTKSGETMHEYQFYCYDGIPRLIQIRKDTAGEIQVSMFDLDLNLLEGNKNLKPLSEPVAKPAQFEKMLEYASKLSRGFPFVRVDLFHVKNRVYFGEMTFYPTGGLFQINPESSDLLMGSYLNLPK